MQVRATLYLRNNRMQEARKRLGLTLKHAARACGVAHYSVQRLERFDYSGDPDFVRGVAEELAALLDLDIADILPEALVGETLTSRIVRVDDVAPERLLAGPTQKRLPDTVQIEAREELLAALEYLSYREREVIEARYGLVGGGTPRTLIDIGRTYKLTKERVRQIEANALRKLAKILPEHIRELINDRGEPQ